MRPPSLSAGSPPDLRKSRPRAPSSEWRRPRRRGPPCLSLAWWFLQGGLGCLLVIPHAGGHGRFVGTAVKCRGAADVTPVGVRVSWDTRGFAPWTWTIPVRAGGDPLGSCHGGKIGLGRCGHPSLEPGVGSVFPLILPPFCQNLNPKKPRAPELNQGRRASSGILKPLGLVFQMRKLRCWKVQWFEQSPELQVIKQG